ncbi:MAG TPA: Plug domain-containing protein [bacterium]
MRYSLTAILGLLLTVACHTTGQKLVARSSTVITAEEINSTGATSAHEAIQLLRPHLLQRQHGQRTNVSISQGRQTAIVYLDGVRYGELESLTEISAFSIAEIRYISSSEATMRFGADHAGGAFLIQSK